MSQDYSSLQVCTVLLSGHFPYEPPVAKNRPASTNRLWMYRITQKLLFAATVPPSSRRKAERKQFCRTESHLPSEATTHLKLRESIINILCKIFLLNTLEQWSLPLRSAHLDHEICPGQVAALKCSPQRDPAPHSNMCPATLTQANEANWVSKGDAAWGSFCLQAQIISLYLLC